MPAFKLLCGEGFPRPCQACAPKVLVLAPTRELATQIEDEARKFGGPLGVKSVCCYGGAPKGPQMASLRQGAHVCIATPGRLNDFLEAGMVDLYACRYLVFDEADRMRGSGVLHTPSTRPHAPRDPEPGPHRLKIQKETTHRHHSRRRRRLAHLNRARTAASRETAVRSQARHGLRTANSARRRALPRPATNLIFYRYLA